MDTARLEEQIAETLATVYETNDLGNETAYATEDDDLYRNHQTRADACAYWRGCNGCREGSDECENCEWRADGGRGFAWTPLSESWSWMDYWEKEKYLSASLNYNPGPEPCAEAAMQKALALIAERRDIIDREAEGED